MSSYSSHSLIFIILYSLVLVYDFKYVLKIHFSNNLKIITSLTLLIIFYINFLGFIYFMTESVSSWPISFFSQLLTLITTVLLPVTMNLIFKRFYIYMRSVVFVFWYLAYCTHCNDLHVIMIELPFFVRL